MISNELRIVNRSYGWVKKKSNHAKADTAAIAPATRAAARRLMARKPAAVAHARRRRTAGLPGLLLCMASCRNMVS